MHEPEHGLKGSKFEVYRFVEERMSSVLKLLDENPSVLNYVSRIWRRSRSEKDVKMLSAS